MRNPWKGTPERHGRTDRALQAEAAEDNRPSIDFSPQMPQAFVARRTARAAGVRWRWWR